METIQLEIVVDNSAVFSAISAFETLQAKINEIQSLLVKSFSLISESLLTVNKSLDTNNITLGGVLSNVKDITFEYVGFAASLVELSGTQTLLGETLRKSKDLYLDFEKTVVSVKEKTIALAGSVKTLAKTAAEKAVAGIKALGSGLLAFGKSAVIIGKSLLTNPIFLIGAVLAGAAALVIANWDSIAGLFEDLKKKLQPIFDDIKAVINTVVDTVLGFVRVFVDP